MARTDHTRRQKTLIQGPRLCDLASSAKNICAQVICGCTFDTRPVQMGQRCVGMTFFL